MAFVVVSVSPIAQAQTQAQAQNQTKELMIQVEDNEWTTTNESAIRPAVTIEEQEDGSVIVYTKIGKQIVANYDSISSMTSDLESILAQMPNWNFTK